MNEAEIRKQVEAEIVAWLRVEYGFGAVTNRRLLNDVADAIERQDYHYPALDRMKLGVQDGRE